MRVFLYIFIFIIMKHIIKKVLNETYEYQQLNDICQKLSTGSNQKSPEFMKEIIVFINNSNKRKPADLG